MKKVQKSAENLKKNWKKLEKSAKNSKKVQDS